MTPNPNPQRDDDLPPFWEEPYSPVRKTPLWLDPNEYDDVEEDDGEDYSYEDEYEPF